MMSRLDLQIEMIMKSYDCYTKQVFDDSKIVRSLDNLQRRWRLWRYEHTGLRVACAIHAYVGKCGTAIPHTTIVSTVLCDAYVAKVLPVDSVGYQQYRLGLTHGHPSTWDGPNL